MTRCAKKDPNNLRQEVEVHVKDLKTLEDEVSSLKVTLHDSC